MSESPPKPTQSKPLAEFKAMLRDLSGRFLKATEPERHVLLDSFKHWQLWDLRKNPRKRCALPVILAVEDRAFTSMIRNISPGGVFIETANAIGAGKRTTLTFWFPKLRKPSKIRGKILWEDDQGYGIEFIANPNVKKALKIAVQRF